MVLKLVSVGIRLTLWLNCQYPKSGEVIQPRIRNKNNFSFVARVVRFAICGDRQACTTPVLGEIKNLWLNTSPFQ